MTQLVNVKTLTVMALMTFSLSLSATISKPETQQQNSFSLQLPFIENQGQLENKNVRFFARTFGGLSYVTSQGEMVHAFKDKSTTSTQAWVLKESLHKALPAQVQAKSPNLARVNYFSGSQPALWQSNVRTHASVSLGEVYKGIQIELKAYGDNIEKLFIVEPGAAPDVIKVNIEGGNQLSVNANGELVVSTDFGDIRFTKPIAYQQVNGQRRFIETKYKVSGTQYSFALAQYDRSKQLVIDPLLASTFLGSTNGDQVNAMTTDAAGNIIVAGTTYEGFPYDFPTTTGAWDTRLNGNADVFVAKFSADLSTLIAATVLGGSQLDVMSNGSAIAVDGSGSVYLTGQTFSADFPTTALAFDSSHSGGGVAFVSKFDSSLGNLQASTLLGDSSSAGDAVTVDVNGQVYTVGRTSSSSFPTTAGAFDSSFNGVQDVYVATLNNELSQLLGSTFLGGSANDGLGGVYRASVELSSGKVLVSGVTSSANFPTTPGSFDTRFDGVSETFVSALDSNLQVLLNSTFFDGSVKTIAADSHGDIYLTGLTGAPITTTAGAFDTTHNGSTDIYVSKLSGNLQGLMASTYIGGSGIDTPAGIVLAADGSVVIAAGTDSSNYPTTVGAYSTSMSAWSYADVTVSRLSADLSNMIASSYFAEGGALAVTLAGGEIVIAGATGEATFPVTAGAYDTVFTGDEWAGDAFISKFDLAISAGGDPAPAPDPAPDPVPVNEAPNADAGSDQDVESKDRVTLDGADSSDADGSIVSYSWQQISGKEVSINNSSSAMANFRAPRVRRGTEVLVFELTVTDDQGASATDQVSISVSRMVMSMQ